MYGIVSDEGFAKRVDKIKKIIRYKKKRSLQFCEVDAFFLVYESLASTRCWAQGHETQSVKYLITSV